MIKHIFIAPIKDNVINDEIYRRMNDMRELKNHVPEIKKLVVEKATGWLGISNSVILVAEFENKNDWELFIDNKYHKELGKTDDKYFKVDSFICTQIEY